MCASFFAYFCMCFVCDCSHERLEKDIHTHNLQQKYITKTSVKKIELKSNDAMITSKKC